MLGDPPEVENSLRATFGRVVGVHLSHRGDVDVAERAGTQPVRDDRGGAGRYARGLHRGCQRVELLRLHQGQLDLSNIANDRAKVNTRGSRIDYLCISFQPFHSYALSFQPYQCSMFIRYIPVLRLTLTRG